MFFAVIGTLAVVYAFYALHGLLTEIRDGITELSTAWEGDGAGKDDDDPDDGEKAPGLRAVGG